MTVNAFTPNGGSPTSIVYSKLVALHQFRAPVNHFSPQKPLWRRRLIARAPGRQLESTFVRRLLGLAKSRARDVYIAPEVVLEGSP